MAEGPDGSVECIGGSDAAAEGRGREGFHRSNVLDLVRFDRSERKKLRGYYQNLASPLTKQQRLGEKSRAEHASHLALSHLTCMKRPTSAGVVSKGKCERSSLRRARQCVRTLTRLRSVKSGHSRRVRACSRAPTSTNMEARLLLLLLLLVLLCRWMCTGGVSSKDTSESLRLATPPKESVVNKGKAS